MNEIIWLSHGGKNSGWTRENGHVPGSQGGKLYKLVSRKKKNRRSEPRTVSGVSKPKNESTLKNEKSSSNAPESEKAKATRLLKEDTAYRKALEENERARNPQKKSEKKKFVERLKEDTEYRKALAENEALKHPKTSSADLSKAAGHFKGAASSMESVSKGVSNAWEALHNAKYRNEDRSKNVQELSNAELRNTIERIKLDQEYNRITMPQKSKGYDRTMAALSVIGTAATITATGLSIAAGVKALRRQ